MKCLHDHFAECSVTITLQCTKQSQRVLGSLHEPCVPNVSVREWIVGFTLA